MVGRDEEGVRRRMKDACFVKIGGARIVDEELKLGSRAEEGEKGVVVDEEGLGLRVGGRGWGKLATW